jgi:hypothetical protein
MPVVGHGYYNDIRLSVFERFADVFFAFGRPAPGVFQAGNALFDGASVHVAYGSYFTCRLQCEILRQCAAAAVDACHYHADAVVCAHDTAVTCGAETGKDAANRKGGHACAGFFNKISSVRHIIIVYIYFLRMQRNENLTSFYIYFAKYYLQKTFFLAVRMFHHIFKFMGHKFKLAGHKFKHAAHKFKHAGHKFKHAGQIISIKQFRISLLANPK